MLQMIQTPTSSLMNRFAWYGETLYIEFKRGHVWAYTDVPEATFMEMREASSVGSFFHAMIKKAFDGTELPEAEARRLGFESNVTADH